jgi:hypothetical protein
MDGDEGTDPVKTGGDENNDEYTYSDGTSVRVPSGESPPPDTSGFTDSGGGFSGAVKVGLGKAWNAVCGDGCSGGGGTERAVTGVRGTPNPLDFGTSGGSGTNGNGRKAGPSGWGGADGDKSDQGGASGPATANATGQTVNLGNKGGGDAAPKAPTGGERLNASKFVNGAIDPKSNTPH